MGLRYPLPLPLPLLRLLLLVASASLVSVQASYYSKQQSSYSPLLQEEEDKRYSRVTSSPRPRRPHPTISPTYTHKQPYPTYYHFKQPYYHPMFSFKPKLAYYKPYYTPALKPAPHYNKPVYLQPYYKPSPVYKSPFYYNPLPADKYPSPPTYDEPLPIHTPPSPSAYDEPSPIYTSPPPSSVYEEPSPAIYSPPLPV